MSHTKNIQRKKPLEDDPFAIIPTVFWCARRDLNPHALALEPKSSVSANSTTGACLFFESAIVIITPAREFVIRFGLFSHHFIIYLLQIKKMTHAILPKT